mmetsp:Transcript_11508/g.14479  ORF Transcript_11508/g.14479 Transcript_11508/m.14479 type:complete len:152 (+) Transcript_11508:581-1036(+)
MINDAVDVVKKTFTDRKYLMRFAILIDVLLFIFLSINVTLLLVGVDQFYDTDQVDAAIQTLFYISSCCAAVLICLALAASIFMLFKLRKVLIQRPVCLTGLCDDLEESDDSQNSASFEVKEANNNTITSITTDDPSASYCSLCQTTSKVMV